MAEGPWNSPAVWMVAIGQLGTIILALINRRRSDEQHRQTQAKIEVVRGDVNGKMQELLDVTGDAREAKGNLAGRAEEKAGH